MFFFFFFFKNVFLCTTPKRNERQVERLFFLFGHARRGKAWFLSILSILFYSILFSLSICLFTTRAPLFSFSGGYSCARLLSECCLLAKKLFTIFFKENLGTLEFCRKREQKFVLFPKEALDLAAPIIFPTTCVARTGKVVLLCSE